MRFQRLLCKIGEHNYKLVGEREDENCRVILEACQHCGKQYTTVRLKFHLKLLNELKEEANLLRF